MKANLIREAVFTLEVGTLKFPGMRVASRWEGLTKLVDEQGQVLIVSGEDTADDGFATLFGNIFRNAEQTRTLGVHIVKGSPKLIDQVLAASKEAA